jgi:hypothetical protein
MAKIQNSLLFLILLLQYWLKINAQSIEIVAYVFIFEYLIFENF